MKTYYNLRCYRRLMRCCCGSLCVCHCRIIKLLYPESNVKEMRKHFLTAHMKSQLPFVATIPLTLQFSARIFPQIESKCKKRRSDSQIMKHQIKSNALVFSRPMPGTIRLVDSSGAPAILGTGRLEFFLNGWGTSKAIFRDVTKIVSVFRLRQ